MLIIIIIRNGFAHKKPRLHSCFFQQNAGKEFVGFWQDAAHQRDLERKVFRYYFFTKRLKDKEHLLHGITALIRNLILAVQKISHYRRKQTFEFKKEEIG